MRKRQKGQDPKSHGSRENATGSELHMLENTNVTRALSHSFNY